MVNNKSIKKQKLKNKRHQIRNNYYKTSTKNLIKLFLINIKTSKSSKDLKNNKNLIKLLNSIYSFLDKGVKKNVFHKNTVGRKKTQLLKSLKTI